MKIKELKEIIKDLDDDMEVITVSNNFELNGSYVTLEKYRVRISNYKQVKETFRDAFDGGYYNTTVYRLDKDGKPVLVI